ncbi:hypothetical protein E4U22_007686 [Claviceps purpurea]|nr:hypothetical protein E4U22_007686 [Claviceps purpurea]
MEDEKSGLNKMNSSEQKHEQQYEEASEKSVTRVAVVGTGLAGLSTAYLLDQDKQKRFSVTVFEKTNAFSLDAASITMLHGKTGVKERVDMPPRSFCTGYYSNLCRMYDYLGIQLQQISLIWIFAAATSDTSASDVTNSDGSDIMAGSYFIDGKGLHGLLLLWRHLWSKGVRQIFETLYLVFCHVWFYACCLLVAPRAVAAKVPDGAESGPAGAGVCETFGAYLRRIRLSRWYVNRYLLPVVGNVCSCPHAEALDSPASDMTGFVRGSFRQKFYVNKDGINRVQAKLSEGFKDVRLQARVLKVQPVDGKVVIRWQECAEGDDGKGAIHEEVFDRVVLAMAPNVAASIFDPAQPVMGSIPTSSIVSSLLAPLSSEISLVQEENHVPEGQCTYRGGDTQTMVFRTNFSAEIVESEALHYLPSGVIIKTSPSDAGEKSMKTLYTARFPRTLRTVESRRITDMITRESNHQTKSAPGGSSSGDSDSDSDSERWYNGRDNVWVVGSWCWDGLVLLEGCVVSATRVAKEFGVEIPW